MDTIDDKILTAREFRYQEIQFLKSSFKSVISVKTNIPGNHKQSNIAYLLVNQFQKLIPLDMVAYSRYYNGYDGPYFLLGSDVDPITVKMAVTELEERHPLGRFIDIDVFNGVRFLSRGSLRRCFLCDKDAFVCIRESNHTASELNEHINKSVLEFYKKDVYKIVNDSILAELNLHPKFGLVTPFTSGSHRDMNYDLMVKAKEAIMPFFIEMFEIGWSSSDVGNIFKSIRDVGIQAEKTMMRATGGVNAYKGLIFNLGILVSSYGYLLYNNIGLTNIFEIVKKISAPVMDDFDNNDDSFGMQAFRKHGFTGARGEVSTGLPSVRTAYDFLEDFSDRSKLKTLVCLISVCQDTVFLKRSETIHEYHYVKQRFARLLKDDLKGTEELNDYCLENELSFGGSADLLILTIFLKKIGYVSGASTTKP